MRGRRSSGFLLVEITIALSIFCGVLAVLLVGLQGAGETTALAMERTRAACRLDALLGELRFTAREARRQKTAGLAEGLTTITSSDESTRLRGERCTIVAEPWAEDKRLAKVTVALTWQSRGGHQRSMSAVTLLRTRLSKPLEPE